MFTFNIHYDCDCGPLVEAKLDKILNHLNIIEKKEDKIMASQAELAQQLRDLSTDLNAKNDQLQKALGELTQKIADLIAAVQAAGNTTPEVDAAVAALQASDANVATSAQQLDDIVPDPVP